MTVLAIETCTRTASVAVVDGTGIAAHALIRLGREHCRTVPGMVVRTLEDAGCVLGDIDAFAAGIGPGSFTGLRVGVAMVSGMAFARAKPTIGLRSLEVLAAQVVPQDRPVWALLETGRTRGDVYWALYRCTGLEPELVEGPGCSRLEDVARRVTSPALLIGDSVCVKRSRWRTLVGDEVVLGGWGEAWPRASTLGLLALRRFGEGEGTRPEDLVPLYVAAPNVGKRRRVF